MIAEICAFSGWTWDYVEDNMTLPRYFSMLEQWKKVPPVCVSVAAYLGAGSGLKSGETASTPNNSTLESFSRG